MGSAAAGREELSVHDGPSCIQVILMGTHPVHELGTHTERRVATSRAGMNRGGDMQSSSARYRFDDRFHRLKQCFSFCM